MPLSLKSYITSFGIYLKPKLLVILVLGFVSGLPLALSGSTLSIWLTETEIDLSTIGLFAIAGTPYTLKFLWSPLIDGIKIPILHQLLGRRRSWLILTQLLLITILITIGMCNPTEQLFTIAILALLMALSSATQDIVIDAYRIEILDQKEQGAGAAMIVLGYRLGMIISGAGALYLAKYYGWEMTYLIMALLIPISWFALLVGGEPKIVNEEENNQPKKESWFTEHVIQPFVDFTQRKAWLVILSFILLYKLGDAFMGVMTGPFLIKIGFDKEQLATIAKLYGVIATIVGSFIGGALINRIGIMRSLWICGILQAITNLIFVAQAKVGADELFLTFSISMENISGGMGTAAFVAFMSSLVNLHFTATQYALLSSFSAFGRTWLSSPSGRVVETIGWQWFFIFSTILCLPGLITLYLLGKKKILR
ncbi:MAG: AmpG family muropeptide MFS transporter [Rickettsiales bacterium]